MSLRQELLTWTAIALSCGLAVAMPFLMWRRLRRPETLREAWMYSRPGAVIARCVIGILFLILAAILMGFLALVYPFVWATVAMIGSGLVAMGWYLVRFLAFDPRRALESLDETADEELRD